MDIVRELTSFTPRGPVGIAIGKFDGIHRGHAELITKTLSAGGLNSGIVTFDVNPRQFLSPFAPRLITTLEEKAALLEMIGLDHLFLLSFERTVALAPAEFLDMLAAHIPLNLIAVGDDFRFGKDRAGDVPFLKNWCAPRGIAVEVLDERRAGDMRISSTVIRKLIFKGELEAVAKLLSAPYSIHGIARELPVPATVPGRVIAIPEPHKILPQNGVYVALAQKAGVRYRSVAHFGSAADGSRRIECCLYEPGTPPLAGGFTTLFLFRRIRDEILAGGTDELAARIAEDIEYSEHFWKFNAVPPLPAVRPLDAV